MNSKGITPVVATVLLMTITVAATASAFTFMNNIQGGIMNNAEDNMRERQTKSNTDINIETAYNSTDGYIITSVRNTGTITLQLQDDNGNKYWSMYVEGKPTKWAYRNPDDPKTSLPPQGTVALNTTKKFPEDSSDKLIKITGPNSISDSKVCYNSGSPSC